MQTNYIIAGKSLKVQHVDAATLTIRRSVDCVLAFLCACCSSSSRVLVVVCCLLSSFPLLQDCSFVFPLFSVLRVAALADPRSSPLQRRGAGERPDEGTSNERDNYKRESSTRRRIRSRHSLHSLHSLHAALHFHYPLPRCPPPLFSTSLRTSLPPPGPLRPSPATTTP